MKIETADLIFYIYEFVVICGLIFRIYLEFEDKPSTRPEVEILPPPRPPESIVKVPEIVAIVPTPRPPRKHPVSKKEYIEDMKRRKEEARLRSEVNRSAHLEQVDTKH
jgi:hypothetical protein